MRALTVRQPWAWAIVAGHKPIENRTQLWRHRGLTAMHAGAQLSQRGMESRLVARAVGDTMRAAGDVPGPIVPVDFAYSAIIGVVDVVAAHTAEPGCCESPWAEYVYEQADGKTRRDIVHYVLEQPRVIEPIGCRGALGLWNTPEHVTAWIEDQLRSAS